MHPDGMNWSWPALEATPQYVRQFCWDFLRAQRRADHARAEKGKREQGGGDGRIHIPR